MSNEGLFKDSNLQKLFDKDGYVVVPFQDFPGVKEAQKIFDELHPDFKNPDHFLSSTFSDDKAYKHAIFERLSHLFRDALPYYFQNYKPLGASFLVKPPGQTGFMPIHQDWTIVDEDKFRSITIWMPLVDVNKNNGAIKVLPGSHQYSRVLRAPTLPTVFDEVFPMIEENMKTLDMVAGEAFIFDHSLIHSSHLNHSDNNRIAATFGLVPKPSQLYYYFKDNKNPSGEIEKIAVDDDFFMQYHNVGERPGSGITVDTFDYDFNMVTTSEFLKMTNKTQENIQGKNSKIPPLFRNEALQTQFDDKGYTILPLLEENEIKELLDFYNTLNNDHIPDFGFHVSLDNDKDGFAEKVIGKLKEVIAPKLQHHFQDFRIFTGSFVVKEANPYSVVPPHQDWTFVDESKYCSATLWIPLVNVNMDNGALGVIEGSHKYFKHLRASPAPIFKAPFDDYMFSIFPYMQIKPMKAGQAFVFNNRTLHGSPPNTTDFPRIAAGIGITQAEAKLYHHFVIPGETKDNIQKLESYEIEPEFLYANSNQKLRDRYEAGLKPEGGKYIGTSYYDSSPADLDELLNNIKNDGNVINTPLIEKLARIFNYNLDGTPKGETFKNTEYEDVKAEKIEIADSVKQEVASSVENNKEVYEDNRTFFQKYTPLNILREVIHRVGKFTSVYTPSNIFAELKHRLKK